MYICINSCSNCSPEHCSTVFNRVKHVVERERERGREREGEGERASVQGGGGGGRGLQRKFDALYIIMPK